MHMVCANTKEVLPYYLSVLFNFPNVNFSQFLDALLLLSR